LTRNRTAGQPADGSDAGTRQLVLGSAAALFAERGYHATSIRNIAEVAGLSKASVYHYVRSKEELLFALASQTLENHLAAAKIAAEEPHSPLESIVELVRAHLGALLAKRASIAFALLEVRSLPVAQFRSISVLRGRYAEMMRSVIRRGTEAGLIRAEIGTVELSLGLSNLLNGTLLWYRHGTELDVTGLAELAASIYLRGVRATGPRRKSGTGGGSTSTIESAPFEVPADLERELVRSGATRSAAIINVAVRSFRRAGYLGTTTRDIARDSGLGNATLYHHVADKEELLFLICLRSLKDQADHVVPRVQTSAGAVERLRQFFEEHTRVLLQNPARSGVALTEARHLSGLRSEQILDLNERYLGLLASIVREGQRSGEIRNDVAANLISRLVMSALNWTVLWYNPRDAWGDEHISHMLFEILVEGAATR
jgi:AcrR family transcriptional regulator